MDLSSLRRLLNAQLQGYTERLDIKSGDKSEQKVEFESCCQVGSKS